MEGVVPLLRWRRTLWRVVLLLGPFRINTELGVGLGVRLGVGGLSHRRVDVKVTQRLPLIHLTYYTADGCQ